MTKARAGNEVMTDELVQDSALAVLAVIQAAPLRVVRIMVFWLLVSGNVLSAVQRR